MEKMFEIATRKQFRFDTPQGKLMVEDLWDLPLVTTKQNRANLDDVARGLSAEVKAQESNESFVYVSKTKDNSAEVKFEIVKYIISVKLAEQNAEKEKIANKQQKEKLLEAIAQKESENLKSMSLDELRDMASRL